MGIPLGYWAERLDRKGKIVCTTVISLCVLAAILGFSAEGERVRADEVKRVNNGCIYPKSSALGLGITGALLFLASQIIVNVFGGCICCQKRLSMSSVSSNRIATVFLLFSWITFFFGFVLMLVGASLNQRHQEDHWYKNQCFVVKPGVFAGSSVLVLATAAFSVVYYIAAFESKKQEWSSNSHSGVTMNHQFNSYSPYPQGGQFPMYSTAT